MFTASYWTAAYWTKSYWPPRGHGAPQPPGQYPDPGGDPIKKKIEAFVAKQPPGYVTPQAVLDIISRGFDDDDSAIFLLLLQ